MNRHRRLLGYLQREWRSLTVLVGLSCVSAAAAAVQPWPLKILVDHALTGVPLPEWLARWLAASGWPQTRTGLIGATLGATALLFCVTALLEFSTTVVWGRTGHRMAGQLSNDLFDRLLRLSMRYHARRPVGDALSRLSADSWSVFTIANGLAVAPLQHLLTLGAVTALAWRLDPTLALVGVVVAPVFTGASLLFGRRLKRQAHELRQAQTRLVSFAQETLTAMPLVQSFDAAPANVARFESLADDAVRASQRGALYQTSYGLVTGLFSTAGLAVVLFVGGLRTLSGDLSTGGLLVFLAYVRTLQTAAENLLRTYATLKPLQASIERIFEVLEAPDDLPESPSAAPLPTGSEASVRIDRVTCGYDAGRAVLHDVTLEVRPGERLAIVGAAGSGKTTLASLVLRFLDPWEGRVTIGGVDLRHAQLASVRAQVALVPQDALLLPLTVAQNIAYGRPHAPRDDIVAAAVAANADGFIRELPDGYDTPLAERGASLSGGQRQRLAIARALKNAPILVLDEPTSALDAGSELIVLEALDRLMAGRTTIMIAHRLSTIRRADRIVVLDGGRVAEIGTHAELMAAGGIYARFFARQARVAGSGVSEIEGRTGADR